MLGARSTLAGARADVLAGTLWAGCTGTSWRVRLSGADAVGALGDVSSRSRVMLQRSLRLAAGGEPRMYVSAACSSAVTVTSINSPGCVQVMAACRLDESMAA